MGLPYPAVEKYLTSAKRRELRSIIGSNKALQYAKAVSQKAVCFHDMLGDLFTIDKKLENGEILLPQYYNLLHIDLVWALDKTEAGLKALTQGNCTKALMPLFLKIAPSVVKFSIGDFCSVLVSKWRYPAQSS